MPHLNKALWIANGGIIVQSGGAVICNRCPCPGFGDFIGEPCGEGSFSIYRLQCDPYLRYYILHTGTGTGTEVGTGTALGDSFVYLLDEYRSLINISHDIHGCLEGVEFGPWLNRIVACCDYNCFAYDTGTGTGTGTGTFIATGTGTGTVVTNCCPSVPVTLYLTLLAPYSGTIELNFDGFIYGAGDPQWSGEGTYTHTPSCATPHGFKAKLVCLVVGVWFLLLCFDEFIGEDCTVGECTALEGAPVDKVIENSCDPLDLAFNTVCDTCEGTSKPIGGFITE